MRKIKNILFVIFLIGCTFCVNLTYAKYYCNKVGLIGENNFLGTYYKGTVIEIQGDSSDNLATIYDNETFFSQDTKYRWTNWSSDDSKRGGIVSLTFSWEDPIVLDQIVIYYFIDHKGVDFPEKVTFEYYDINTDTYIEIIESSYVKTNNYTDTYRDTSDGFRYILFDGNSTAVAIDHTYTGTCPYDSLELNQEITTTAIRLTLDGSNETTIEGKSGYFVGMTEFQLYNNGILLDIEP